MRLRRLLAALAVCCAFAGAATATAADPRAASARSDAGDEVRPHITDAGFVPRAVSATATAGRPVRLLWDRAASTAGALLALLAFAAAWSTSLVAHRPAVVRAEGSGTWSRRAPPR